MAKAKEVHKTRSKDGRVAKLIFEKLGMTLSGYARIRGVSASSIYSGYISEATKKVLEADGIVITYDGYENVAK